VPEDLLTPALLVAAGLVAGTINSIAGGGSLLTLPLLILIGLPPTVANASNRIGVFTGGVGGAMSFHKRKLIPVEWVQFALPPALVGTALGTWAAMTIGDVAFERLLAGVLVVAAAWMIWRPVDPIVGEGEPKPPAEHRWLLRAAFLALGFYGGLIQAGIGFLFLAVLSASGLDLVRGNAVKVTLILAFTALSIPLFAMGGMLDWTAGLTLAVGQYFGGRLGVHLQVLKGQAWVRNVLTVTIVLFAIKLLFGG
jgi:uncharacterized membrane protein YfcA